MQTRIIPAAGVVIALAVGGLTIAQDEAPPAEPAAEKAANDPSPEDAADPPAGDEPAVAREPAAEEKPAPDPVEEARLLVSKLSDESYQVREEATRRLWELGETGLEALEAGFESEDPEVAHRSRLLLQRIRTGITPETPPDVVELVQQYFRSGTSGKNKAFVDLQRKKAYPQMLRLYRFETDPAVRSASEEIFTLLMPRIVQEQLFEDNVETAEELLRLAPVTDANCRRLAALLRVQGTLDDELQRTAAELELPPEGKPISDPEQRDVAALHLALLRAKGSRGEARELASRLGRDDVLAGLALFEGDAEPYLRWVMKQEEESPIVRVHAEAVLNRWQGDNEGVTKLMKSMAREAREGGEGVEREALLSLLLNGALDHGLPILIRDHAELAFGYYDSLEQPLKALGVKEYTGTAEEKAKWLSDRIEEMERDWLEAETARFDVLMVASLLHARGEPEEARKLSLALSRLAEAEGAKTWLEFLGRLTNWGGSLHELAFLMAAERLGDDDADGLAADVIAHLFREGEAEQAGRIWKLLADEEELGASERLLLLGAVFGEAHVETRKLAGVLERLRKQAGEEELDDHVQFLADLLVAAEGREDAGAAYELLLDLSELGDPDDWTEKLARIYAHMAEWQKSVALWEKVIEAEPQRLDNLAPYAAALIRAGMPEKADEPLHQVERFTLHEPSQLPLVAGDLQRYGAEKRSEDYWRTVLMTSSPRDRAWHGSASEYARHAQLNGQWRVAAAFAEVDAMREIMYPGAFGSALTYLRKRFAADLYRGLALVEEGDREQASQVFRGCFELLNGHGLLADDYFPLLREAGMTEQHDRDFETVYQRFEESIEAFPNAHNTYNSAAWVASRANRNLDDALEKIQTALSMRPKQAAYLDTMAEVWFAKGNREKAVEWSWKAVQESFHSGYTSPEASMSLRGQYERFRDGEFPVP